MKVALLLTSLALVAGANAQTGTGGAIPLVGAGGGGNAGSILPTSFSFFPLDTPVAPGATGIASIELVGLAHTWAGDVQIVLRSPGGTGYNLVSRLGIVDPLAACCGTGSDFGGDYTIVPAPSNAWSFAATPIPGGTYQQDFGVWIDGSANVFNTDLGSIPCDPGTWVLEVYDGASGDNGSLVSWAMNCTFPAGCPGGPGGAIPTSGTGGTVLGTPDTMLPGAADAAFFPLSAPIAPSATSITSVELKGLTHTWINDVQIVLRSPSGTGYNLVSRLGGSGDFGGDYMIVAAPSNLWPATTSGTAVVPPGTYEQFFGTWVNGSDNVFNTDLASIPVEPGTWVLEVYDWVSGDGGGLTDWSMCVDDTPLPFATNYCGPAVPNSSGNSGVISATGVNTGGPGAWSLELSASGLTQLNFQSAYFLASPNQAFIANPGGSQGNICITSPHARLLGSAGIISGGTFGPYSVDLGAIPFSTMGNTPVMPGDTYNFQLWYRDINPGQVTNFTDAVSITFTL